VIGDDTSGQIFKNELVKKGISPEYLIVDKNRHTTRKTRVIAHNQQVVRIDRETRNPIDEKEELALLEMFDKLVDNVDGIIISDYFKGVITEKVAQGIVERGKKRGKFVSVDPKEKHFQYFKGVSIITPNQKEAGLIVGEKLVSDDDVYEAGKRILNMLGSGAVLIKRGEKGMTLFENSGTITNLPTVAREVYDVTGAGDTVIAVLTAASVAGANLKESALISNYAAGIIVGQLGTAAVTIDQLKEAILN
ncbi:MAG: bifunctional heptose 7-phosphate kinase/heptose 1-phosphate adenyltransferase, partial [bacterium]